MRGVGVVSTARESGLLLDDELDDLGPVGCSASIADLCCARIDGVNIIPPTSNPTATAAASSRLGVIGTLRKAA
ncbi:MAG: hypothetical protein ACLQM6_02705 [Acidobacteriaceae bacterium]